jgi:hypothetical protein
MASASVTPGVCPLGGSSMYPNSLAASRSAIAAAWIARAVLAAPGRHRKQRRASHDGDESPHDRHCAPGRSRSGPATGSIHTGALHPYVPSGDRGLVATGMRAFVGRRLTAANCLYPARPHPGRPGRERGRRPEVSPAKRAAPPVRRAAGAPLTSKSQNRQLTATWCCPVPPDATVGRLDHAVPTSRQASRVRPFGASPSSVGRANPGDRAKGDVCVV